ncbi:MAG: aminotransferase class I/II-fold pyridoxal phosphate-dependent enzyme, partial [Gillisia sp.]
DYARIEDLNNLALKYPQLHLYYDDVHGMSWKGKNGSGYVMSILKELPANTVIFGTLSKTFGASGSVMVCADPAVHSRIKTYGGPLTFSAQLDPASVGAAIASANIHLSPEIYELQDELFEKVQYFNSLLEQTDLPLIEKNDSPVFFIGTGLPITGYKLVKRLMDEGFYVNLGIFPAVPVKNTGLRITISRHNRKKEIAELTQAIQYHFPLVLEETGSSLNRVKRAFKIPLNIKEQNLNLPSLFEVIEERSIHCIDKKLWNSLMGERNVFDWAGLSFLEKVFCNNKSPENNWDFYYFVIKDKKGIPVLCTFLTFNLWKDDMLASASVSMKLEEKRKSDPYLNTSEVLNMGSIFTEGTHLYLDQSHPQWKKAFQLLLKKMEVIDEKRNPSMTVLRDFPNDNLELNNFLLNQGFVRITMPEASFYDTFHWNSIEEYISLLSKKSRKHFLKDIEAFRSKFDVVIKSDLCDKEITHCHNLYKNVKENNTGLNTFTYPKELIQEMSRNKNWEFILLYLKKEYSKTECPPVVGVMFCYKNLGHTYVPNYIGMNYEYAKEFQVYRQLLFQTILRAKDLGFKKIDFGLTAAFEKRKVGAQVVPKFSYVQARDNFFLERLEVLRNENQAH